MIVTGVGRKGQVGDFVARTFATLGAFVVAVDHDGSEVNARVDELQAAGLKGQAYECDLTSEAAVSTLASAILNKFERVDALINLAGGFSMGGPLADSDFQLWQRQFAINLTTAYLATRALLPLLRPARGSIVYMSSAAALPGAKVAEMSAYAAAKGGVITLMRAVAEEERERGVRANALAPSAIRTAANVETMGESRSYVSREEVAATITLLCSEEARPITGQVIAMG
ncbi:MAG: SDR family NAD(P)-dependent oxidoreductase [Gemmatimonadaceae bacterium]